MALAGSRRPQEVQDLAASDEAELRQRQDPVPIQRRLEREVEAGQGLDRSQPAHAQRRLDAAVLAQGQLFAEQDVDGFERADLALIEPSHDLVQRLQRPGHLQTDEVVADAVQRGGVQVQGAGHARLS
jgi:hypothetical protein